MAQITIRDLSFSYPDGRGQALSHIDLTVEQGEYLLLCGRSGCGKTTLLRQLKPCLSPHGKRQGRIFLNGRPIESLSKKEQATTVGFVLQNPREQIVTDKVWHELAFGPESLGMDPHLMRLRVGEMASYFGIQHWFHRNVSELSGGQLQLLNLAAVMVMQPQILILDEPTAQLDPIAAGDFLHTVERIHRELGTTILMTEHRLEEVYPQADRVVVMDQGKILSVGKPQQVGQALCRGHEELFYTLPTPARIFYEVGAKGDSPLTVREGRKWLSDTFPKGLEVPALPGRTGEVQNHARAVLRLRDAFFRYEREGQDVLRGVDLTLGSGELHAIVGGNGTGKSTLLKAICGICKIYDGKVEILGKNLKKYKGKELFHQGLTLLPQDPCSLFGTDSVRGELEEMGAEPREVARITELCQIGELLEAHPSDLSGGEQQRVALAKVLLTKPKLLLLDEPTKGLDGFFKISFAKLLEELKAQGIAILMVSHDVEFCAEYADVVSLFFDGKILTSAEPRTFFSDNSFYTTAANRMSRHLMTNAVLPRDVVELYRRNRGGEEQ